MTFEETAALSRVRAGDPDAFEAIVRIHARGIRRVAARIVGGGGDAADDVVQETFLRAFRALDRFDDRLELAPWLHRIAANAAIDAARRRGRELSLTPDEDGFSPIPEPESTEPSPARRAVSAEVGRATRAALAELSPSERAAFILRHYEGQSIPEISKALGKRDNATKQSIFRAVRKLRRALASYAGGPEVQCDELA
jgi:RNA polymerase sigma-70 factor (ECF subfamily)